MTHEGCGAGDRANAERRRKERKGANRRERALQAQRDVRALVDKHGLTDILRAGARAIVIIAIPEEGINGKAVTLPLVDSPDTDYESAASRKNYVETGEYLPKRRTAQSPGLLTAALAGRTKPGMRKGWRAA